jgi:glycosyltransferase involved in cell wall biosynthesis
VVTTLAPGCRETVLDGQTGFLVPVRDAGALAEAMEKFIADPGLAARMGAKGRDYALGKYDVHLVNQVILEALGLQG